MGANLGLRDTAREEEHVGSCALGDLVYACTVGWRPPVDQTRFSALEAPSSSPPLHMNPFQMQLRNYKDHIQVPWSWVPNPG